jgi:hypothetical protein
MRSSHSSGILFSRTIGVLAASVITASYIVAQDVQIEFDRSVDFSKLTTFSIGESQLDSKNPSLNNEKTRTRLNLRIQKCLEEKGLTFAQDGPSSLKVIYMLDSTRKVRMEGTSGPKLNNQVAKIYYIEGTLTLGLLTPQSLVWRSVARVESDNIEGKLDDMVKKSIAKYPPKHK